MRENLRNQTKQTQKCPKSDFLAIFGLWEALKIPYRCDLKLKLVELLMGHNLKAFRAKKLDRVGRGGQKWSFFGQNMASEPSPGPWMGEEPLKLIVICPIDVHWMIWDEFETFCFGQEFFLYICILYNGDIGQLVFFFRGVQALAAKRFEIGGVSFRVISSPINAT